MGLPCSHSFSVCTNRPIQPIYEPNLGSFFYQLVIEDTLGGHRCELIGIHLLVDNIEGWASTSCSLLVCSRPAQAQSTQSCSPTDCYFFCVSQKLETVCKPVHSLPSMSHHNGPRVKVLVTTMIQRQRMPSLIIGTLKKFCFLHALSYCDN